MTFAPSSDMIYAISFFSAIFWSVMAIDFPVRTFSGPKLVTGEIWAYLKAMVCPIFAAISWYIMSAMALVAGNVGNTYFYFQIFFWFFLVVFFPMTFYLAYHPIVDTLSGRNKLED